MSFTSNDTLRKIEKLLPESIHNQSVPKDVLGVIDEYIPKLNNKNISQVVKDYLSNSSKTKQQVIDNYGPINNWDVSQVTNLSELFKYCQHFNENISKWNVSNVTNMRDMFCGAIAFNQSLNNWNVSNVVDMSHMFDGANNFNQSLHYWDVSKVVNMKAMFSNTRLVPMNEWY